MRLIEIVDAHGKTPTRWVNVDHMVSVTPTYSSTDREESVSFELKLDGVPLQRFGLARSGRARRWSQRSRRFCSGCRSGQLAREWLVGRQCTA